MPQLLLINPNTSAQVTDLLLTHARRVAGPEVQIRAITASFGAPYISCEASYAVAGHATLEAWVRDLASSWPAADAVLIGCFGDPGLLALQQSSRAAVTGLAQAAMKEASSYGKFSILTGGERWKPILFRLAQTLAMDAQLVGIHTVEPTGAQLAQDPSAALVMLRQACRHAVKTDGCKALILGGAGLAGIAAQLADDFSVPIIDSVSAGVRQALLGIHKLDLRGQDKFNFDWPKPSTALPA
uniref:Asp/Glu/hydantoin racemase n=1 Tax=Polaromonas sp. E10S TaxID=1840239 RepID=A0A2S1FHQ8_9BURK|nr:aspartate/glutamate racemase family protein [Polaromonas sp. E10S]AWD72003.1 Asp/Glu/hydantoin racemase [Polaromonas sp. E10S]